MHECRSKYKMVDCFCAGEGSAGPHGGGEPSVNAGKASSDVVGVVSWRCRSWLQPLHLVQQRRLWLRLSLHSFLHRSRVGVGVGTIVKMGGHRCRPAVEVGTSVEEGGHCYGSAVEVGISVGEGGYHCGLAVEALVLDKLIFHVLGVVKCRGCAILQMLRKSCERDI